MSDPHDKIVQERRKLKTEYGALFDAVTELLFRHDPAGINFEINPEEYQYETSKILPRLRDCQSAADVCRVIHEELAGSFDAVTAGPIERHSQTASEIWKLWQSHQSGSRSQ
jgi:hypothetical protein